MSFIKFQDRKNYERCRDYLLNVTVLQGISYREGGRETAVFFVNTATIFDLKNQGVRYREISESELRGELSIGGYQHYEFWKERSPELFNEELRTLTPPGSVEIHVQFHPADENAAENIFAGYASKLKKSDVFYFADVRKVADLAQRVSITAIVKKSDLESIIKKLESEGIEHDGVWQREQHQRM